MRCPNCTSGNVGWYATDDRDDVVSASGCGPPVIVIALRARPREVGLGGLVQVPVGRYAAASSGRVHRTDAKRAKSRS